MNFYQHKFYEILYLIILLPIYFVFGLGVSAPTVVSFTNEAVTTMEMADPGSDKNILPPHILQKLIEHDSDLNVKELNLKLECKLF